MELQLGNIERCRTLYQKYIEWSPSNAGAWGRWVTAGAGAVGCAARLCPLVCACVCVCLPWF